MAVHSFHDQLLGVPELQDALAEYGPPSQRLLDFIGYNISDSCGTLELGISALSVHIAKRARQHTCIVPSSSAADAVRAMFLEQGVAAERVRILAGELPEVAATLPAAGYDHVVLSAPFAFPAYFAVAHAAFRLVKPGRRLTVRGTGVWTVDQLRNFLRVDPGWDGMEIFAEDALAVTRQPLVNARSWREQPYVLVNSAAAPDAGLVRTQVQQAGIRSFSSTADRLHRQKAMAPGGRSAGLVGYYGFGNYGDELFRLGFEAGLPDTSLPVLLDIPRRPYFVEPKTRKMERVDAVVIGGGDLLIPGYWTDLYFENEYLTKPVFLHGVGVPGWTGGEPGVMRRMADFLRHPNVKYISVRDIESKLWVEKHLAPEIEIELTPDIVCGMDFSFAGPKIHNETPVFGLIVRKQPPEQTKIGPINALIERAREKGYSIRLIVAGSGPVGDEDYAYIRRLGLPADDIVLHDTVEGTTRAILSCDALASMKFHGCVVGLMAGIPTVGLITTDKFRNFYRMLGLEHLISHYFHAELPECLDRLAAPLPTERIAAVRSDAQAGMARLRARLREHTRR